MPHCILKCKNDSRRVGKSKEGITFHRFPRPGQEKTEQWISFVQKNRGDDTWLPTSRNTYICSKHFREQDFYTTSTGRRYLYKSTVPYEQEVCTTASRNTSASPTSLLDEPVSDSESIFDTPRIIKLKKDLRNITKANKLLTEQNKILKRRCRYLKTKNLKLTDLVKKLKSKFPLESLAED